MALDMHALVDDLAAETAVINDVLMTRSDADWDLPTPAEGWAIRDQISHLAYFDETATLAASDPDRFRAEASALVAIGDGFPDAIAERYRMMPIAELKDWFTAARGALIETFGEIDPKTRLPWYGPDMSAASSVTARLMETWAHGQDIVDTLGVTRTPTARLRNIAHLGVSTRSFAYRLRKLSEPEVPVYVALDAPDGDSWTWGAANDANSVTGTVLDFCLVVTQRRHLSDTTLHVTGDAATEWMSISQAFAGGVGSGRAPGQFALPKESTS